MKLTRRAFIQASFATGGLLVVGTPLAQPVTNAMALRKAKPAGPAKGEWVSTACQGCTQWCAIQIFVQNGRAVSVRGNPLSKTNEAHKLTYIRGRYSPTSTDLLYGTLPRIYGTTNYFSHSAICAEAEKMGPGLTQGFFGYRDYDLANTQCLVAWGADPLASNRMVPNTIRRVGG